MFRVLNKSATRAEILIYGDIGPVFWGDEVSAADFAKTLRDVGEVSGLDVRINSYGGDVFDGLAIYRQLVDHPARVTMHIDGIAASAASVIAMAGDVIRIGESARVMIHDAWTIGIGDAASMRETADRLDETSEALAGIYASRTGRTATEMRDAMRAETWYTGQEAIEAGLAHELAKNKGPDVKAAFGERVVALDPQKHRFKHAPQDLLPGRQTAAALVARQLVALNLSTAAARKRA